MKRLLYTLMLLILSLTSTWAMGEWTLYSSSSTYRQMAALGSRLYTLCGTSIYWYDRATQDSGSITIADGMHGSDVAFITSTDHSLVIVYRDGLVDVLDAEGRFHDFTDLQNRAIIGSRTINAAKVCGNELLLACDFGVMGIDLDELITRHSFTTATPCLLAFAHGDYLYYSSQERGLLACRKESNMQIANSWQQVEMEPIIDACVFTDPQGKERCWYTAKNTLLNELDSLGQRRSLNLWNNQRLFPSMPYVFCSGWGVQIARIDSTGVTQGNLHASDFNSSNGYFAESDTSVFMLHSTRGIEHLKLAYAPGEKSDYELEKNEEDNPYNHNEYFGTKLVDLEIDANGSLVAINGGQMRVDGWNGMITSRSIINTLYTDQSWSYIFEDSVLNQLRRQVDNPSSIGSDYYRGLTDLATHPEMAGRYYVGTLNHGLYVFQDDSLVAHYDVNNTTNGPVCPTYNEKDTRLTALAFGEDGTLWTAYSMSDCPLVALNPSEDKWCRHPLKSTNGPENIGRIIPTTIGQEHLVWLVRNSGYQKCSVSILYCPNPAQTNLDQSVTFSVLTDQDGNNISPYYIYDICEDLNHKMWILTSNGPLVVEDQINAFNYAEKNSNHGLVRRIKIPRNDGTNLADYLMAEVSSNCMAIDNYNRKWVGTVDGGLYLLSADCITQLEHFTTQNSLLPSNEIVALHYDRSTNRLFISTSGGLACYQTDDLPGEKDFEGIYCYPNPVRPEYTGDLRIMGLMEHSTVSVTTTDGQLIYRGQSEGGTLTWDLITADGKRLEPGIYLIHGVDSQGSEGNICKFLVL